MAGFGNYEVDPNTGRPIVTIRPQGGGGAGGAGLTPFMPAAPTTPEQTGPTAQAAGLTPFAPAQQKAQAPVGSMEAAGRGAIDALSFGSAPVIAGLSAASGLKQTQNPDENIVTAPGVGEGYSTDPLTDAANLGKTIASPFVGAARLATNAASSQPDQSIVDQYNQAREQALSEQQQAQQQHPGMYLAGELGGAAVSLPLTGGGATAAGTLAQVGRAARAGAIGGGGFGAGTAASEGGSAADIAKGAAGGAVAGGALGAGGSAALEVAGTLGRKVVSAVRGHRDVDAEASRRIVNTLREDFKNEGPQFTPQQVAASRRAGTPAAIVDTGGERTRAMARSAANTSPEARQALTSLSGRRFEQQGERVSRVIRNLGGGSHAALDNDALRTLAAKANAPAYRRAQQIADRRYPNGIWSPELEQLMSSDAVPAAMQKAMTRGRDRSVSEGLGAFNPKVTFENGILKNNKQGGAPAFPDLQLWDYTQRALRDAAREASRAGREDEAGALFSLHRQLLDEIDHSVPEFGSARGQAAAFFKASDALEAGQNFVMSNADIAAARLALQKMNPVERELFGRGFASELADKIAQVRDGRNVLNSIFLDSSAARQKIELALGRQGANELEAMLRGEEIVDRLRTALGNSTTARQLAEMGLAGGAVATFEGLKEHSFNPAHIIAVALTVGAARHGAKIIDEKVARRVGEMLASNDPAILAKGLKVVASRPVLMNALRNAGDVSARELVNYLRPSGVAAGALTLSDKLSTSQAPSHQGASDYYDQGQDQDRVSSP